MHAQKTSSLKTYFDEIEETNGDNECRAWLNRVFDLKAELAIFVARHRAGGGSGTYIGFLKGSFNFSFRFSFDGGPDAIIRFPKPGHTATAYRDEKVANEVQIMEYLRQNTTIPIPYVHSWGLTAESPQQLGPFIIMDYVEGVLLSTILKRPPLSTRMRDSWRTRRFWFDYAARKSFDVDMIYWVLLHNGPTGAELLDDLDDKTRAEMESFTQTKMEQLKAYKEECTALFSSQR